MLCPPTSSQAVLGEKMNVWGMLIRKTTLGGNSYPATYHTLFCLQSCSHCFHVLIPRAAIQIFGTGNRITALRTEMLFTDISLCDLILCACTYPVPSVPRVHDILHQQLELLHFNARTHKNRTLTSKPQNFKIAQTLPVDSPH